MTRLLLGLEYDGSDFCGWQLQDDRRSVQGVVEQAIAKITQETVRISGAGRTDAGVHARGQCAHFDTETRLSPLELRRALNAVLPDDVAVTRVAAVSPDFHARNSALEKGYDYRILRAATASPLRRRQTWHLRGRLDLEAMRAAARSLLGEHDFAAFRGAAGGADPDQGTVRTLRRLEIRAQDDEVRVRAEARGFLRYMVRNLVGTLVEVAQGRRGPEDPARVLASRDRSQAAPAAPAHGLCLLAVRYPDAQAGPESAEVPGA